MGHKTYIGSCSERQDNTGCYYAEYAKIEIFLELTTNASYFNEQGCMLK